MPLDVATVVFKNIMLRPVRDASLAKMEAINLVAGTYTHGTVLGQLSAGATNDVQTINLGGTPTGGTFTITVQYPVGNSLTTAAIAYNASAATVQAALAALANVGSGNVTVTGSAQPGNTQTITFGGALAARPVPVITATITGLTGGSPTVTIVHSTTGSTGGAFGTYASGNSDGTQLAEAILAIDCVVDAAGYASFSSSGAGGLWGEKALTVPAYYAGDFNVADLIGLDANAVTVMKGRYVIGSLSAGGIFHF